MSKLNTKEEEKNTIIENVEEPLLALHEINRSINNYLIVNYTASELILEVKKELETTLKNI